MACDAIIDLCPGCIALVYEELACSFTGVLHFILIKNHLACHDYISRICYVHFCLVAALPYYSDYDYGRGISA